MKTPKVRGLNSVKREILKLIECYVSCAEDLESVSQNMVLPFFEAVLSDYCMNVDLARNYEVLNVLATMVNKLRVSRIRFISKCVLIWHVGPHDGAHPYHPGSHFRTDLEYDYEGFCRVP